MSRSSRRSAETRRLGENELLASFDVGLTTLSHLANVYDGGYSAIAFVMASEVHKLLTENNAATRLRSSRVFSSPDYGDETKMLNAMMKPVGAEVGGDPINLRFIPDFYHDGVKTKAMAFRDWWNRDVVYRASAAPPGTPPGMIPVNGAPSVAFEDRERLTRRELIALVRNKVGAHQAEEWPRLLDELDEAKHFSSFNMQTPTGMYSTDDGSLPITIAPIPAMIRQITHEVLVAYDRVDLPPLRDLTGAGSTGPV